MLKRMIATAVLAGATLLLSACQGPSSPTATASATPQTGQEAPPPGDARRLAKDLAGLSPEQITDLTPLEATEVEVVEDGETGDQPTPIWFTLVTCEDGSEAIDQVWVRDAQDDVHGAAISFEC
ncbi:MAG: hypothetical protein ACI9AD_000946 [Nitriliruptoraceae bacterium]|jgi:hypothetical protein